MYSITLKSVLNKVQPIKGFVYESVQYSKVCPDTIEAFVLSRQGCQGECSGCNQPGPTYDHLGRRIWIMPPLFAFRLVLIYTMRRIDCVRCGVTVERVPWATGKHSLVNGFRLLLARWARLLSWVETAVNFGVSWADVYASIRWVVDYGLKRRVLENIHAIGIDEICVRVV